MGVLILETRAVWVNPFFALSSRSRARRRGGGCRCAHRPAWAGGLLAGWDGAGEAPQLGTTRSGHPSWGGHELPSAAAPRAGGEGGVDGHTHLPAADHLLSGQRRGGTGRWGRRGGHLPLGVSRPERGAGEGRAEGVRVCRRADDLRVWSHSRGQSAGSAPPSPLPRGQSQPARTRWQLAGP